MKKALDDFVSGFSYRIEYVHGKFDLIQLSIDKREVNKSIKVDMRISSLKT